MRSEDILNAFDLTKIFGLVVHLHLSTNFWQLKSDAHIAGNYEVGWHVVGAAHDVEYDFMFSD
jgi:hypothetical protein